jgi:hypothetical protein
MPIYSMMITNKQEVVLRQIHLNLITASLHMEYLL